MDLEALIENVPNAVAAGITVGCIHGLMCIVQWRGGKPAPVFPPSIAVQDALWTKV